MQTGGGEQVELTRSECLRLLAGDVDLCRLYR